MGAARVRSMSGESRGDGPGREVAAQGGRLTDPEWLVNSDPEQVVAVLDGAVGPEEALTAAVYRASGHTHRDVDARVRRQVLALDAARYGNRELAREFTEVTVNQEAPEAWMVQWATSTGLDSRLRHALRAPAKVGVVATVVVGDRGLAVAGCEDGTLHWWDLDTGRKLGQVAADQAGAVRALATAVVDGRPLAFTAGSDVTVRVWDLAEGEPVGAYRAGDEGGVSSLATALVEGRPVVVAGSSDGLLRVWDPAARTRDELVAIRTGVVQALATAAVDGRPVAVTGHGEGAIRRWDLITGRALGAPTDDAEVSRAGTDPGSDHPTADEGDDGWEGRRCISLEVNAMTHLLATDPAFECPLAIGADAYETYIWNLATGERMSEPGPGFAEAAALTVLHGRPTALVAFGLRGPVAVWDLFAPEDQHPPLTGHERTVRGTATAVLRGRHLAVTGGDDRSVRIWDLEGEKEAGSRPAGEARPVQRVTTAVVDGRSVIVTGGSDAKVRIWDLDGGGQLGEPLTGHTAGVNLVTVGTVEGRPALLTRDRHESARIWDLTTREELPGRATKEYTSTFIEFFAALEGRFVAVTGEGRVWDLGAGAWTGMQPQQKGALALATLEGREVVLTGARQETVQLWDLATGERIGPLLTHSGEVSSGAAGMLDGRLVVATGAGDRTVRVWDALSGQQIGAYAFPAGIGALAFAADGRLVVRFGSDMAVLVRR